MRGEDFRDAYRRALADLHRQQRTRRGRGKGVPAGTPFGRARYRREPPAQQEDDRGRA